MGTGRPFPGGRTPFTHTKGGLAPAPFWVCCSDGRIGPLLYDESEAFRFEIEGLLKQAGAQLASSWEVYKRALLFFQRKKGNELFQLGRMGPVLVGAGLVQQSTVAQKPLL